jgi:hypothetical protein
MNREDIIPMAQEARLWDTFDDDSIGALERFAALVAAAEREECASLVEQMGIEDYGTLFIAAAIRAKGRE